MVNPITSHPKASPTCSPSPSSLPSPPSPSSKSPRYSLPTLPCSLPTCRILHSPSMLTCHCGCPTEFLSLCLACKSHAALQCHHCFLPLDSSSSRPLHPTSDKRLLVSLRTAAHNGDTAIYAPTIPLHLRLPVQPIDLAAAAVAPAPSGPSALTTRSCDDHSLPLTHPS